MKIKLDVSIIYDTDDKQLWNEYLEYMDDHTLTITSLQEFLIDRYINPNFDKAKTVSMELVS